MRRSLLLLLLVLFVACSKRIELKDVTYEGVDAAEGIDATEGVDAAEGVDATEGIDATEGADATEGVDATASLASSCVELGADAIDKNVRLYLDGDAMKPYPAHCSADLRTYIPLEGLNLSSYPVGGCGTLAPNATVGVTTTWQMIRFDTVMHAIDTGDYTFATSTGGTHETSGGGVFMYDYLNIPFGSGRSCTFTAQTVATIDLTGTHFELASLQTWAANGFLAATEAAINPQRTMATITATGFPVGTSPCAPNDDYYTTHGGTCLQLEYVP